MNISVENCLKRNKSIYKYKRKQVDTIGACLENVSTPINIIVTGLRYVGKTVILEQVAENFSEDSLLFDLRYVTFSDSKDLNKFYDDLEEYIERSKKRFVLLDEVTLSQGYDVYISAMINRLNGMGVSFVISGSSHLNLEKLSVESLGCRSRVIFIQPFSFAEWLDYKEYTNIGVYASNPQVFVSDIEECKEKYSGYMSSLRSWFKEYLSTYNEFMAKSKGLRGYLAAVIEDTVKSNSRGYGTESDIFNVDEVSSFLRLVSFKHVSTKNLDVLKDDYSDYFAGLPKELKSILITISTESCIKRDKEVVKRILNIQRLIRCCMDFKLIYLYKSDKNVKSVEEYLNAPKFNLSTFLQDYNIVLANLPLFLYYLEDIINSVNGKIEIQDLLQKDRYGSFVESYILGKYSIAFMQNILNGYKPIQRGNITLYAMARTNPKRNRAGEVDLLDEINKIAIEISTADKSEEHVYFCNEILDESISSSEKILVTQSKNNNWVLTGGGRKVIRVSYPILILLLEFIDFGNIEIELGI